MTDPTTHEPLDDMPAKPPGWLIREVLRLYTYPFVLLMWLVPPLQARVSAYMRQSLMVWKVFVLPFREAQAEARATANGGGTVDRKAIQVLVVTALCLTALEYFGMSNRYSMVTDVLRALGLDGAATRLDVFMGDQLHRLMYWAIACLTCYFFVPALVVKLVFRERLSDYGLKLGGAFSDAWIYVLFFGTVAPALVAVSYTPHFQQVYPFYDVPPGEALWPRFWSWEVLYFAQFFALEFFFRGFLVHGLRHRFGWYSVVAMAVPYCMIHYGKPLPETLGAIIAGVVLGSLSLKSRSIWLGVAIHTSVAISMDLLSLSHKGLLFAG
ncbi:MAG: CPBP family intramembrane metalloprotease [Myxococcales bacterium]|nr:CPBP family intramembrane metalloprotease [Myxococcales bacterium]MCB9520065.1 CPBP family intramembrane metalloprotease [Myxococcales bacterium]